MKRRAEGGFTLLEVVIGVLIMTIMVTGVMQLYVSNLQTLTLAKARSVGLGVAAQQMEYLRDLPYDSLATQNGTIYPAGNIPDNQTVVSDNISFNVLTEINYADDPYDGVVSGPANGKPQDLYPYDYKRIRVRTYLTTHGVNKLVDDLSTDIAGKAAETSSNTGIISLKVVDANGNPVPNANVTITDPSLSPAVNISTTTDDNGSLVIPKLPPDSTNGYQVIATLPGYSTDGTIPDPAGTQTATKQNLNVIAQQISAITLAIDKTSTLNLHVVDTSGTAKTNFNVTTTGAKTTKANPTVYKYTQTTATDASGNITLSNIEWDSYTFTVPSGYYVVSSSPYAPYALGPNTNATVNLIVASTSTFPDIDSVAPNSAQTGGSAVAIKITGRNLSSSTTITLQKSGQTSIVATGVVSSGGNTILNANLNLTGAATGAWDLVVSNANGSLTQTGGFSVTP